MPQLNVIGTLSEQGVVRVVGDKFVDMVGNPIQVTDRVDTWADLQAIPKISGNNGLGLLVSEIGVGPGSVWIYDHPTTKWYPQNGSVVMGRFFNVAKVGAYNVKEIFAKVHFPSSGGVCCLGDGDTVSILESYDKTGANGVYSKGLMVGSAGTVGADVSLDYSAGGLAANINVGGLQVLQRSGNTTIKKLYSAGSNTFNGPGSTGNVTPVTVPNINTNGIYISSAFELAHTSDSVVFEYGEFILRAGV